MYQKFKICKSFELKIDKSHLSKFQSEQLFQLFREGKWLYNHLLHSINEDNVKLHDINTKDIKSVQVKNQEIFETKELTIISSQMKQSIHSKIGNSLSALHQLKLKGRKVGKLKYKPEFKFNCIPLKQYNNTYKILNNNYISIQSIKGKIKSYYH